MSTVYKVYITPRTAQYTYGTEVDVSDYIDQSGVGLVKKSVDATDYDIGLYYFGDITLKGFNKQGYFNDPDDRRSIFFPYSRDLAKVRVVFSNENGDTITFNGLINDSGTTFDVQNEEVTFSILTKDSVIRDDSIPGGVIANASTVQTAFAAILNVSRVTSVLNYDDANNNPANNFIIDDGSWFDDMGKKDAIEALLAASNSVLIIDSDSNIIIKDRTEDPEADILSLYGKYDQFGRENILAIKNYNNGLQRMFNSIVVTNSNLQSQTEVNDPGLVAVYGLRQKTFDFPFITNAGTQADVANQILETFKAPKIEMQIDVPTYLVSDAEIFDLVSINYPLRVKPHNDLFFPIVGQTRIGSATEPLPDEFGSTIITPNLGFKIIEIVHNEKDFITTLKVRQVGSGLSDGIFNTPTSNRIDFAVIGQSRISSKTDLYEAWNPSILGAGKVGFTRLA